MSIGIGFVVALIGALVLSVPLSFVFSEVYDRKGERAALLVGGSLVLVLAALLTTAVLIMV